jgi:hypothetical protein
MECRPAIPAALKRQIFIEAGHRCAIPTCRVTQIEIAHIVPWSEVREHKYENLIALCPNCHTMFDKGMIDKKCMEIYKNQLQFLNDRYTRLELDVMEELDKKNMIPFPAYMSILIKRIVDEGFVNFQEIPAAITLCNIRATPDKLLITNKGKEFVRNIHRGQATYEEEIE